MNYSNPTHVDGSWTLRQRNKNRRHFLHRKTTWKKIMIGKRLAVWIVAHKTDDLLNTTIEWCHTCFQLVACFLIEALESHFPCWVKAIIDGRAAYGREYLRVNYLEKEKKFLTVVLGSFFFCQEIIFAGSVDRVTYTQHLTCYAWQKWPKGAAKKPFSSGWVNIHSRSFRVEGS